MEGVSSFPAFHLWPGFFIGSGAHRFARSNRVLVQGAIVAMSALILATNLLTLEFLPSRCASLP